MSTFSRSRDFRSCNFSNEKLTNNNSNGNQCCRLRIYLREQLQQHNEHEEQMQQQPQQQHKEIVLHPETTSIFGNKNQRENHLYQSQQCFTFDQTRQRSLSSSSLSKQRQQRQQQLQLITPYGKRRISFHRVSNNASGSFNDTYNYDSRKTSSFIVAAAAATASCCYYFGILNLLLLLSSSSTASQQTTNHNFTFVNAFSVPIFNPLHQQHYNVYSDGKSATTAFRTQLRFELPTQSNPRTRLPFTYSATTSSPSASSLFGETNGDGGAGYIHENDHTTIRRIDAPKKGSIRPAEVTGAPSSTVLVKSSSLKKKQTTKRGSTTDDEKSSKPSLSSSTTIRNKAKKVFIDVQNITDATVSVRRTTNSKSAGKVSSSSSSATSSPTSTATTSSKKGKRDSKQDYMSESSMMTHEILTMAEEQRLGQAVQRANTLQKLIDSIVAEKPIIKQRLQGQRTDGDGKMMQLSSSTTQQKLSENDDGEEEEEDDDDDNDQTGYSDDDLYRFKGLYGELDDRTGGRGQGGPTSIYEAYYVGSTTPTYMNNYYDAAASSSDSEILPYKEWNALKSFDSTSRMTKVRLRQQRQRHRQQYDDDEYVTISEDDVVMPNWNYESYILQSKLRNTIPLMTSQNNRYYNDEFLNADGDDETCSDDDDLDESIRQLTDDEVRERFQLPGGRAELQNILLEGAVARDKLISSNLKLVNSIAKKWAKMMAKTSSLSSTTSSANSAKGRSSSLHSIYSGSWDRPSLSEAVQEGTLGLAKAADRFNPKRGLRFSTYATYWITNSVRQCFQRATSGCVRLPINIYEAKSRFKALVRQHWDLNGHIPTVDDIAKDMNMSRKRLQTILRLTQPIVSIDAPLLQNGFSTQAGKAGGSDDSRGGDSLLLSDTLVFIENDEARGISISNNRNINNDGTTLYDAIELSLLRQCLEDAMAAELAPHERDVVRLRLGLDDGCSRTCKEVSQYVGGTLSTSEVRSTEQRAFKKLRSPRTLSTYKLLAYLDFADVDAETIKLN